MANRWYDGKKILHMENYMKVVSVRNVIQMVSLIQNLQESQPFGDSATETIGGINSESDSKEALKSIRQTAPE